MKTPTGLVNLHLCGALLTTQKYESLAVATDRGADGGSMVFPLLGLFGETGSLLSEVKKKQRDASSYVGYADAVVEELGDVLWYLTVLCSRLRTSLSRIAHRAAYGSPSPETSEVPHLPFARLQHPTLPFPGMPTPAFEKTLLRLASEVGALLSDHSATDLSYNPIVAEERLEAVLRLLIKAAEEAGITLEAAATANLEKVLDRWPNERIYPEPFDQGAPESEQLPRSLTIDMFERTVAGQTYVFQQCNGINIGDRLTDNSPVPDDYRFHDVFHFANAAVLGWSPVLRALLRLKRKSDPAIDESEDGARPALIEEGVVTWIFGQAEPLEFFAGLRPGELPFGLLKQVRQFVGKYEGGRCPLWVWEEAILQGYAAFRFVRDRRRARFHIDLRTHKLSAEALA